MQLSKVLEKTNQLEKNSFIKIIDGIISESDSLDKQVQKILNSGYESVKNADNLQFGEIFDLTKQEYIKAVKRELSFRPQIDIIVDILIRDGNCIMSRDWFSRLYEKEHRQLKQKLKEFDLLLSEDSTELDATRKRDYNIFRNCVETAYRNDEKSNRDAVITEEEQSILNTLSKSLNLSLEEVRLIRFSVVPLEKMDLDDILKDLKDLGILFYSKKNLKVYVPDEIVSILRQLRGFEVANKYYRRVLIQLKDSEINQVCRNHNINWKNNRDQKIRDILNQGLSFQSMVLNDIHKEGISKTQQKTRISEIIEKGLSIEFQQKGSTAEERVEMLTRYFQERNKEDQITISLDGYTLLLKDLAEILPSVNKIVKAEFELEYDKVLDRDLLIDYNIKPQDILDLIPKEELIAFCDAKQIKSRGSIIHNILDTYQDSENLLIENYNLLSTRDLAGLKEKGIHIKESELGIQFEEVTKRIFTALGFNVDEDLRKKINSKKDKADIVISLSEGELIIVECKTKKDKEFNQYSSVSRQVRSYFEQAERAGYKVVKTLLVANEFSDEFIKGCELDFEISLSLMRAGSLLSILEGFKESTLTSFPYKLLLRDVLLDESRIIRSLKK